MTEAYIKDMIRSGWPFFGVAPSGDVLARYVFMGPVYRWSWNHMIPTPVQDDDLCWLLQAATEEGHSIIGNKVADHSQPQPSKKES